MRQVAKCADDDTGCVRKLFRRIRTAKSVGPACKKVVKKSLKKKIVKKAVIIRDPLAIPDVDWQREYTCSGLNKRFKAWLRRQHLIRAYFLREAHRCQPEDAVCLKAFYRKLVIIHRRIRSNRSIFLRRMNRCDRCSAIKLRFMKWYRRQVSKRRRLHLEIGLCEPWDHECMDAHVQRILAIQKAIKYRWNQVLDLHHGCANSVNGTTVSRTQAPFREFSGASALSALTAAAIAIVAVVAFF